MTQGQIDAIELCIRRAGADARALEPWPDYFIARGAEMKALVRAAGPLKGEMALEIGCGIGFCAAILSLGFRTVIATDLPKKDSSSHSPGIATVNHLAGLLERQNIRSAGASLGALPFRDGTFDLVFAAYSFQYAVDKAASFREIARVLRPGGRAVLLVPTAVERVSAVVTKYEYLFCRALGAMLKRFKKASSVPTDGNVQGKAGDARAAARAMSGYFFLSADGGYKSYRDEILSSRPKTWLVRAAEGGLVPEKIFTTEFLPLHMFFFLPMGMKRLVISLSRRLAARFGGKPLLRRMGQTLGLVLVKKGAR